jgi:hypothetical protein
MWHYGLRKSISDNLVNDTNDYFCIEIDEKEEQEKKLKYLF